MRLLKNWDNRLALLLSLLCMGVYASTASPQIDFWDAGEFAATAHTLGIPHQPGTPLYVLVGRVWSILVPDFVGSVGFQINLMSAFFASLAVSFSFLTILGVLGNWREEDGSPSVPPGLARVAGLVGAAFLAFSHTFWINAIEAEVYSIAAFTLAFTAWLAVKWYERRRRESSVLLLLITIYLMGLAVGFHMGSLTAYFGVFALVLLCRDSSLRLSDLVLGSAAIGAFIAFALLKLPAALCLGGLLIAVVLALHRSLTWGTRDENRYTRWFALAGIALFLLGLSVHFFMMIRAHHDPLINQSDPTTFDRLLSVLLREQYPPRNPLEREADLWWQFQMFWGSTLWRSGGLAGERVVGYLQQFSFTGGKLPLLDLVVPTFLWLSGLVFAAWRNWRLFAGLATILLVNSVGLIILLNFTDGEVRQRDYFYFGAWQFLAVFLGLGVGGLFWLLRGELGAARARTAGLALGALLLLAALAPVLGGPAGHAKWFEHDRSDNSIAWHYGRNILKALPEDAILMTNGDNDTFPLWYLQEVEGFRTDVRVVNLSLINLPWYLKQLRDYEPTVPIRWTDAEIDAEEPVVYRNWRLMLQRQYLPNNEMVWPRDIAAWHIARENNWERDIYYAITVPDENIGQFLPYLSMEGMAWKLTPERSPDGQPRIDADSIWRHFDEVYEYDGVLTAEGTLDSTLYRDRNTQHLLRNYPASLSRAAYGFYKEGRLDDAIRAAEMAWNFEPGFPVVVDFLPVFHVQKGDVEGALEVGRRFLRELDDPVLPAADIGMVLMQGGYPEDALRWARELVERDPSEANYVGLLYNALLINGDTAAAAGVLDDWDAQGGDARLRGELERMGAELMRRSTPGVEEP